MAIGTVRGPVSVALARVVEGAVRLDALTLAEGATIADALAQAVRGGLLESADLADNEVAVFGRRCAPDEVLHDGDRIELLGPLLVDPKEARQRRVAIRRAAAPKNKWRGGR